MKNNLMRTSLFDEKEGKNYNFSRLNFVFGPSNSGKTTFIDQLNSVFLGKTKSWTVNGVHITSDEYNVIYVPSADDVSSHLKLSSKSLVRKSIEEAHYSDSFEKALETIKENLLTVEKETGEALAKILPGAALRMKSIDNPLSVFMDSASVSVSEDSTSINRKMLFRVIAQLTRLTEKQSVVIIDDFDDGLSEEGVLSFLQQATETSAIFILSSRRALPQCVLDDQTKIYCTRNQKVYEVPDLSGFLVDAIEGQPEYVSFEEYMIGRGYTDAAGIAERYLNALRKDQQSNLLRIMTSEAPVLSDEPLKDRVAIIPRSADERKLYESLFSLLEIPLDNN